MKPFAVRVSQLHTRDPDCQVWQVHTLWFNHPKLGFVQMLRGPRSLRSLRGFQGTIRFVLFGVKIKIGLNFIDFLKAPIVSFVRIWHSIFFISNDLPTFGMVGCD